VADAAQVRASSSFVDLSLLSAIWLAQTNPMSAQTKQENRVQGHDRASPTRKRNRQTVQNTGQKRSALALGVGFFLRLGFPGKHVFSSCEKRCKTGCDGRNQSCQSAVNATSTAGKTS
jgi:hypothetical protein